MHRSPSTTRVSDDHSISSAPSQSAGGNLRLSYDGTANDDLLPVYSPSSHASKRQRSRMSSAVHLIPVVLLVCPFILWLFSTPVDLIRRSGSVASAGAIDVNGTHNSLLPH